jgi:hypothetical protein
MTGEAGKNWTAASQELILTAVSLDSSSQGGLCISLSSKELTLTNNKKPSLVIDGRYTSLRHIPLHAELELKTTSMGIRPHHPTPAVARPGQSGTSLHHAIGATHAPPI